MRFLHVINMLILWVNKEVKTLETIIKSRAFYAEVRKFHRNKYKTYYMKRLLLKMLLDYKLLKVHHRLRANVKSTYLQVSSFLNCYS